MTYDKKLVEDWLCEHFPYHLRVNKDIPNVIKSEARRHQAEQRRKDIEQQLSGSKYGIAYTDGTERITQLNRSLENNLMKQIEYLTSMLYSQLGITQSILDGTADEFEGKTRTTSDSKKKKLVAIIANLADYSLGATKGGEVTHFTQFDIDFNQEKSLLETRCSGALTRVYSAIAIEEDVTTASSGSEDHAA